MSFRFNNGIPNQLTLDSTPWGRKANSDDHGVFIQDRWTVGRLTATGGLRYDFFYVTFRPRRSAPANSCRIAISRSRKPRACGGTTSSAPGRGVRRVRQREDGGEGEPQQVSAVLRPAAERRHRGRDVFDEHGAGRAAGHERDPGVERRTTATVPTATWSMPVANGECGAMSPSNFGSTRSTSTYDPRSSAAGASASTTGSFPRACSTNCCRACRWTSATPDVVREHVRDRQPGMDGCRLRPGQHHGAVGPASAGAAGYSVSGLVNVKPDRFSVTADN